MPLKLSSFLKPALNPTMNLDNWVSLFIPAQTMTSEERQAQIIELFKQLPLDAQRVLLEDLEDLMTELEDAADD